MYQTKLSADPTAMTLGIIALVIALTFGCCGFLAPIGLILSIIGLVSANRSLQEYRYNAHNYFPQSRSNVATAKAINIIALILNGLITLFIMIYFLVYGTFFYLFFDNILKQESYHYENVPQYDDGYNYDDYDHYDELEYYHYQDNQIDSLYYEDEEIDRDTLHF